MDCLDDTRSCGKEVHEFVRETIAYLHEMTERTNSCVRQLPFVNVGVDDMVLQLESGELCN